ncbi:ABC transporter substrate-binding protein [Parendozoicomonas haliclonae]|uniref:Putative ABC transporter-binding protein n=1 Tax=Parendozoicomonas haliclonae TaxID=1960125 RepID=A0A1X7ATI3_9GAMM|nr:ABC transporter substrate-binding protein [Parendozoicomonas haliclonae]SMA50727.1 putative ABC transporter-binding protein precursor [Parendozoicomonas haliclonae]
MWNSRVLKKQLAAAIFAVTTAPAMASEVTFLNWVTAEPSNKPVIEGLIAKTGVETKVLDSAWGDMQKTIFLRLRTKQPLDVSQLQARWLPTLANMPNLVDFNDLYGQEYLESVIPAEVLEAGRINGKQLGLPWNTGSISLVANRNMLETSGITEAPVTVEQFVEALRKVKAAYPQSTPYALMTKSNGLITADFQTWLWAHGGLIFDQDGKVVVNSAETVATLKFLKSLVDEGLVSLDVDRGAARRMFGQESSAFYFDAPVARGFARDFSGKGAEYDKHVYPIKTPVLEAGMTHRAMEWGHLLVLFNGKAAQVDGKLSKEAPAVKFIEELAMNPEIQLDYFTKAGAIPGSKEARADSVITSDQYIVDWNNSLGVPRRDQLSSMRNSANFIAAVGEEVQAVILGQKSAEEAAKEMEVRIQRLVK